MRTKILAFALLCLSPLAAALASAEEETRTTVPCNSRSPYFDLSTDMIFINSYASQDEAAAAALLVTAQEVYDLYAEGILEDYACDDCKVWGEVCTPKPSLRAPNSVVGVTEDLATGLWWVVVEFNEDAIGWVRCTPCE